MKFIDFLYNDMMSEAEDSPAEIASKLEDDNQRADFDKFADIQDINEADDDLKKLVDGGKAFWITTKGGHHACIDKDGKLLSGMFKGKTLSDVASK